MTSAMVDLNPIAQALVAGLFTWLLTALGAGFVFFVRSINRKLLASALGFAAGVMIAASFWSLLAPALEMSANGALPAWLPPAVGFLLGGAALRLMDRFLPHLHLDRSIEQAEGVSQHWRRSTLLVLAIVLHNVPEGLAVGVAFGAVAAGIPEATLSGAVVLAIGIGIQNMPEGLAVSVPLRGEGLTRLKSFWWGQLSGIVEPIAAVAGAVAVVIARPILPYALSFAAGAMIFVVIEELIPESQSGDEGDIATLGAMLGFAVMMILDVSFG
ncbi:MAG: ZIP family metal transporter [Vicinamibacteria bacterium]|nr:ZIP family metal transporter [Vicinamibacteria bacterium]